MRIFLTVWLLATAVVSTAQAQSTPFRGVSAIEDALGERLNGGTKPFSFYRYLGSMSATSAYILRQLLGANVAAGGESSFQNGHPNSVNMLLWYMVLYGLADELQKNCDAPTGLTLQPSFAQALHDICAWPNASAKTDQVMGNFWLALMDYDAPPEELDAWKDFFLHSSYADKPGDQVVAAMSFSIFYNPHFLLRK